jgi:hypothetical protein
MNAGRDTTTPSAGLFSLLGLERPYPSVTSASRGNRSANHVGPADDIERVRLAGDLGRSADLPGGDVIQELPPESVS